MHMNDPIWWIVIAVATLAGTLAGFAIGTLRQQLKLQALQADNDHQCKLHDQQLQQAQQQSEQQQERLKALESELNGSRNTTLQTEKQLADAQARLQHIPALEQKLTQAQSDSQQLQQELR